MLTRVSKLVILVVIRLVYFYQTYGADASKKTVLILNQERFQHDLKAIALDSRVRLLILPSRVQTALNSIFLDKNQRYKVNSYVENKVEVERLVTFTSSLIDALHKKYNLCGILTCSFYYQQDMPYQFAGLQSKVPFYVLFKEYMKDDCMVDLTIEKYRQQKFKFYGETIFSANFNIKKILLNSDICKESQISVIGSPRFDALFVSDKVPTNSNQKCVTLFSFLHSSGGIILNGDPIEGNFFTDDKNDGFYNLFEQVHVAISELAVKSPDIIYFIKTKWGGPWHEKIISTVFESSGIDIRKQNNIILDYEEDAQSLIKRSSVVVAFNSTTVIEAGLLNTRCVVPIFGEAKTKYFDTNVLYTRYLESLTTASSKKDLKEKIEVLTTDHGYYQVPEQMVKKFITAHDGKSAERLIDEILRKH